MHFVSKKSSESQSVNIPHIDLAANLAESNESKSENESESNESESSEEIEESQQKENTNNELSLEDEYQDVNSDFNKSTLHISAEGLKKNSKHYSLQLLYINDFKHVVVLSLN